MLTIFKILLAIASVQAVCYDSDEEAISDCTCSFSCGDCGYSADPVYYRDCLTCSNLSYELTVVYDDGTGHCQTRKDGCYESYEAEEEISDCTCHESCGACGYSQDILRIHDFDDCITCADPSYYQEWGICYKTEGCYENEEDESPMSDCECHETCGACGYSDDPTGINDCLSCSDSSYQVTPVYDDGSGHCEIKADGCWEDEDDDLEDYNSDCTCHESCGACGYNDDPTDYDDCLTCSDPTFEVNPIYADGSGDCQKIDGCYDSEDDSIGTCECHEACGACGYYSSPIVYYDCITCSDQTDQHYELWVDGTGTCQSGAMASLFDVVAPIWLQFQMWWNS